MLTKDHPADQNIFRLDKVDWSHREGSPPTNLTTSDQTKPKLIVPQRLFCYAHTTPEQKLSFNPTKICCANQQIVSNQVLQVIKQAKQHRQAFKPIISEITQSINSESSRN